MIVIEGQEHVAIAYRSISKLKSDICKTSIFSIAQDSFTFFVEQMTRFEINTG